MGINFFDANCQDQTNQSKFGLCDDPPPSNNRAYIDTEDCNKWIAIVENNQGIEVMFTAIDNCIEILRPDGKMDSRCDGMLTYGKNIIFVELKERKCKNSVWVEKGEQQLRNTISIFIKNHTLDIFEDKKAYIANGKKPNFQSSQMERIQKFKDDTGFILVIKNNITIS